VGLATLLNLPEKQEKDQAKIIAAIRQWFTTHDGWLLIIDNADDLAMAGDFLPGGSKGHLLLTTRAHAIGSLANGIEVEKMDSQQGMLLLLRRAKVLVRDALLDAASQADRTAAATIVQEMDGLPLALDQAGAFIEETGCSVSDYLQRYRQRQDVLLKRRGGPGKDHPEPVATTWSLSFERVEQLDQLATELLRCCAFLAPDAIPEQMIIDGASKLGKLMKPVTENIVKAVDQAFPDVEDYRNWPRCQQYLPHAQVCVDLIDALEFTFYEAGRLLNELAYY
jgi:hypothetical protein